MEGTDFYMKKIVIFGATGNVGSYVLKYALEYFDSSEYEIVASGRRKTDFFKKKGIKYYPVDISKEADFDVLPQNDVFAVVYLAAQIPSYMEVYQPQAYIQSNIVGAFNVLEYCRKTHADRVLFSTTVFDLALYGNTGIPLKSDLPFKFDYKGDHALYVISKNTALELIEHYHQEYGLKKFIFRFPTIYSYNPYHYYFPNGVKTLRPVYYMIDRAKKGAPIELWGDPHYSKDMVHVYDCAQMLCKAVEVNRNEGLYNVGTGIPVTLQEQIETIIRVFSPDNAPSKIIYRPEKKAGGGFLMNIENAKEELGYRPQYDCMRLFLDFKLEMEINRFEELHKKE